MRMQGLKIALEELGVSPVRRVDAEPKDSESDVMWFRHCSPVDVKKLVPLSYKELEAFRPGYDMEWRRKTEEAYHEIYALGRSGIASPDSTFLYATIVDHHFMGPPEDYDGFTYYFSLTKEQTDNTLFEIIDANHRRPASRGWNAMMSCILEWGRNKHKYSSFHQEGLGDVHPRIEVIIPFEVYPELYFPPKKDR